MFDKREAAFRCFHPKKVKDAPHCPFYYMKTGMKRYGCRSQITNRYIVMIILLGFQKQPEASCRPKSGNDIK